MGRSWMGDLWRCDVVLHHFNQVNREAFVHHNRLECGAADQQPIDHEVEKEPRHRFVNAWFPFVIRENSTQLLED